MKGLSLICLVILITSSAGSNWNETCFFEDVCDQANTVCRPRGCDGYVCQCKVGFTVRDGLCKKVSLIGGSCTDPSDCLDTNWACTGGVCSCKPGFSATSDNFTCFPAPPGMALGIPGDCCSTTPTLCLPPSSCVDGTCTCPNSTYLFDIEEKWLAYPGSGFFQCRLGTNSFDYCNGSRVTRPDPPTTTVPTTTFSATDAPATTTTEVSIPLTGVGLNETCIRNSDCREVGASCKPMGCGGYKCACDVGYISRDDIKCIKVSLIGGSCSDPSDCLDTNWACTEGVCSCKPRYSATSDRFTCFPAPPGMVVGIPGDGCDTTPTLCLPPASCADGTCSCPNSTYPFRIEEKWLAYPGSGFFQCRLGKNSFDYCNGSTIIRPGVGLNETCTRNSDCREVGASCKPKGCDGYKCLCDVGYISRDDVKCTKVSLIGGSCTNPSDCLDTNWLCTGGVCSCKHGYSATSDNFTCFPAPPDITVGVPGDACNSTRICLSPACCDRGICTCTAGSFPLTFDEKWLVHENLGFLQCRFGTNAYNYCNGTVVTRPGIV